MRHDKTGFISSDFENTHHETKKGDKFALGRHVQIVRPVKNSNSNFLSENLQEKSYEKILSNATMLPQQLLFQKYSIIKKEMSKRPPLRSNKNESSKFRHSLYCFDRRIVQVLSRDDIGN